MSIIEIDPVDEYAMIIKDALAKARESKPLGQIDPPLAAEYIEECIENFAYSYNEEEDEEESEKEDKGDEEDKDEGECEDDDENEAFDSKEDYPAVETACRDIFYDLLVGRQYLF